MIPIGRLGFDPIVPWPVLAGLALLLLLASGAYVWRGGKAPLIRLAGLALLLLALAGPRWIRESREPAADIVTVLVDQSDSLRLAGRLEAAKRVGDTLAQRLRGDANLTVRVQEIEADESGTPMIAAVERAVADLAPERNGGVIIISDGQIADPPPNGRGIKDAGLIHALIVGDPARGDRRLKLISSPSFAILGEPMRIEAVVEDPVKGADVAIVVAIDGAPAQRLRVRAGTPFTIAAQLAKRGANLVTIEAEAGPQEISLANNRAAFQATGVRDRLRVLLITGEPFAGARVWRNLLKSDPSVDLVHFTILRSPETYDPTPRDEVALIEFPHRELFEEKLDQFDLIIFDRYRRRGILEYSYFENIARRVEGGGALLVVAGPYDAGLDSLSRTPLAAILPSQPLYAAREKLFRPAISAIGARHPVLRGLPDPDNWGRWDRLIEANATGGATILTGGASPLLVLDRAGKGRVAQFWSDQIWYWARGHDGGGPHAEMLRRLAHWLMQEPELDEERLTLRATPEGLLAQRATLADQAEAVEITGPDGAITQLALNAMHPGVWEGLAPLTAQGIYEARSGARRAFAAIGPLNPKEAAKLSATDALLRPIAQASGGGVFFTGENGAALPEVRRVAPSGRAHGANWLGTRQNGSFTIRASSAQPLGPAWIWALLGLALLMWAWHKEGR